MEIISFTLGVLTIIIAAFVAVLVWGIVKVVKQQKQIDDETKRNGDAFNSVWRNFDEDRKHNYDNSQRIQRDTNLYNEELSRRLDGTESVLYRQINDQVADAVTQSKSYTDSRIDKLIDTYFEVIGSKKQIIKG
jgi:hypothetical protein